MSNKCRMIYGRFETLRFLKHELFQLVRTGLPTEDAILTTTLDF